MANQMNMTLQKHLEPGERLLWAGQPNAKRIASPFLQLLIFAIPWTAFAMFWMWKASGIGDPPSEEPDPVPVRILRMFFSLAGFPFVLIGLGMASAPVWVYCRASKTMYAVTDRRVLIIADGWPQSVEVYAPSELGPIERVDRSRGVGDVYFASVSEMESRTTGCANAGDLLRRMRVNGSRVGGDKIGFIGIPDAVIVEGLLLDQIKRKPVPRRQEARE
jgi:hypothetical protein